MAALALVGAGLSAYSAIKEGENKKYAYEMEANFKRAQSNQVKLASLREADLTADRARRVQAAQAVGFASSGVQATSGSPLMMLEDTAANAWDEINAIKQASEYKQGSLLAEAGFSGVLGQQAEQAGYYGAAGSILTVASKNPYSYDQRRSGF